MSQDTFIMRDVSGVVTQYDDKLHFGFIRVNDTYNKIFFHISNVSSRPVEAGDKVTFDLYHGPKGEFAKSVELSNTEAEDSDAESVPEEELIQQNVTGVVRKYNDKRHFGFITVNDMSNKIFFQISNVSYKPVEAGNEVTFDLYHGQRGEYAKSVELSNTEAEDSDAESVPEEELIQVNVTGVVQSYNDKRHFGFITVNDTSDTAFFHISNVSYKPVYAGDEVTFDLYHGPKGDVAKSVEFSNAEAEDSDAESVPEEELIQQNVTGVVQNFNDRRLFGFITANDTSDTVFFHISNVSYKPVEAGDEVTFDLYNGPKGDVAKSVECSNKEAEYSDAESVPEEELIQENVTGVVQSYNDKRLFGFITVNDTSDTAFFHISNVSYKPVEAGDEVTFDLYNGPKGYVAKYVECSNKEAEDSDAESVPEEELIQVNVTGVVQSYNDKRLFGFITVNDTSDTAFFHISNVSYKTVEPGDEVTFDLYNGPKGDVAKSVEFSNPEAEDSDAESVPEEELIQQNVTGVVQNFNDKRLFGFITVNDTSDTAFFHISNVSYKPVEAGDEVTFDLYNGPKGDVAKYVECSSKEAKDSDAESDESLDPEVCLGAEVTGVVKRYLHNHKYGFITANDTNYNVFFHISDVFYQPVEVGDEVRFALYHGPKGYFAESVELVVDLSEWDDDITSVNGPSREEAHHKGREQGGPSHEHNIGASKTTNDTSRASREKGNVLFKSACVGQESDKAKVEGFKGALEWYRKAYTSSKKDEDLASAAKNFGTASWKLAKLKMNTCSSDKKIIHAYLKDALEYFSKAYARGTSMGGDWSQHLETSIKKCLDDIRSWIAPRNDDDRVAALNEFVGYMPECSARASCYLHIATIYFRKGEDAIKHHEYKKCQGYLDECSTPLAKAKKRAGVDPSLGVNVTDLEKDVQELQDVVKKCLSKAEGEQARQTQERTEAREKEKAMGQLKDDLKKLERLRKLPIEDFIKEIFIRWPPKGAHGSKPPCVSSSSPPSSSSRKLLIRAIRKYHPDKVDKNTHGIKLHVMSCEITKCLNLLLADVDT